MSYVRSTHLSLFLSATVVLTLCMSSCGTKKVSDRTTAATPHTLIISSTGKGDVTIVDDHMRDDQRRLTAEALTWLGAPYRYGGEDRDGVDCSGLTMMTYKSALGIKIPRRSADQQKFCQPVKKSNLEVGDLVFFCTGRDKNKVSHVGIYLGDSQFIHASSTKGVVISRITDNYFTRTYHSSGHVARNGDSKPPTQPETQPLQFEFDDSELDRAIESRIDSLMTAL